MDLVDISRVFLGVYFTFLAVFYAAKLTAMRRRHGRSHVARVDGDGPQSISHGFFHVFRISIWALCILRIWWPNLDDWLLPIKPMWTAPILISGMTCMVGAFAAIMYTHSFMGENWNSGVVPGSVDQLVTQGPFKRTRNPLFLSVAISQFGFFLTLPSGFTLLCMIAGFAVLSLQVRIEEQALSDNLGLPYQAYAARTPRWL
jgi:protein-S-isoprenylcysteine O-methyltransferase Ste14